MTTTRQAASAVASILSNPDSTMNRYVFIQSFVLTRQDILKGLKAVTPGDEWSTTEISTYEIEKQAKENMAKGDMRAGFMMLKVLSWRQRTPCGYGRYKNDNRLLGLPEEDLEETLKSVLLVQKESSFLSLWFILSAR